MSVHSATMSNDALSYVYDGVTYQRITDHDPAPGPQRAGLATCLSQGLTTGAALIFVLAAVSLLYDNRDGYDFPVVVYFPLLLCYGLVPGFVEGLVMWICTRVAGRNLRWYTRLLIAGLVFAIPYGVVLLVVFAAFLRTPYAVVMFLIAVPIAGAIGVPFGLLTGSGFSPWRQLIRGDNSLPAGSWFAAGVTGLVLRLAIAFFFMETLIALILIVQSESWRNEFIWAIVLLLHFVVALAIVFTRLDFRLLLPLALVANIPIALFLNYSLTIAQDFLLYLSIGYLGTWASFLIVRCPGTYGVVDFIKEEIRYYLID